MNIARKMCCAALESPAQDEQFARTATASWLCARCRDTQRVADAVATMPTAIGPKGAVLTESPKGPQRPNSRVADR